MHYIKIFNNFEEAILFYDLKPGDSFIKFSNYKNFMKNNIIIYNGIGAKFSSGQPKGNQIWEKQKILLNRNIKVFFEIYDKKIIYVGKYEHLDIRKKMAFNGFMYFEFKLIKKPQKKIKQKILQFHNNLLNSTHLFDYSKIYPLLFL